MVVLTWSYSPSLAWMTVNFVLLPRTSPQAPHFLNSSSVNFFFQWSSLADFTSNVNVNNDPWNTESTKGGEHIQQWKNIKSVSFVTSLTQLKCKRSSDQPQATAGEKTSPSAMIAWHLLQGQDPKVAFVLTYPFNSFFFHSEIWKYKQENIFASQQSFPGHVV